MPKTNTWSDIGHKLRPAKVRNALRRRWFENRLERIRLIDAGPLVALGSSYGSWLVPEVVIGHGWTCYCVGAGGDTSFDMELVRRFDATVRAFDPVEGYIEKAIADAQGDGRFSAHQAAIATYDGTMRMQVTHDERSRSVSSAGLYESERYLELPARSIPSFMAELGDARVDLLKIDVEGGEYELLPSLDLRALGVKLFAVQLHHTGTVRDARGLIARLGSEGFAPVGCSPAVKLTFLDRRLLPANR